MAEQRFYVPATTGTYADALAAVGAAQLLHLVAGCDIRITADGGRYALVPASPVDLAAADFRRLQTFPGYPYVRLKQGDRDAPSSNAPEQVIDYEEQRERLLASRKLREAIQNAKVRLSDEDQNQIEEVGPRRGWYLIQNLNVLQALGSHNKLHAAIRAAPATDFTESVRAKFDALARGSDPREIVTPFAPSVAAVQAFSPTVGKGVNRPKPDGASLAGLPPAHVDWFEEWLRFVGIHLAAYALPVDDDIKLVVIAPRDVNLSVLREGLRPELYGLRVAWRSMQIDIGAALHLAEFLIRRSEFIGGATVAITVIRGRTPRRVVGALQGAYFQSLGQSRALTNVSTIGLPGWFPINSQDDATAWLQIIDEHRAIVRALDEDNSEEAALLQKYRDFLSANDLWQCVDFAAAYGAYVLRAREAEKRVPQLTTVNLRRLIEGMEEPRDFTRIVQDEGFRRVAAAIRRATVSEQFIKASKGEHEFEIRYGLLEDLRRKARFADQFLAELSKFISLYNQENARHAEIMAAKGRPGRTRPQVTTEDIQSIVGLVQQFGSEPVAMLLVAYGSAREPREEPAPQASAS